MGRPRAAWTTREGKKADLPGDAPKKLQHLAVSEEKMQSKAPSKWTDPQDGTKGWGCAWGDGLWGGLLMVYAAPAVVSERL